MCYYLGGINIKAALNFHANKDFIYASIPAKWVDSLILAGPGWGRQYSFYENGAHLASKFVASCIFPFFLSIDTAYLFGKTLLYRCISYTPYLETKHEWQKTADQSWTLTQKCFGGLLSFAMGAIYPDIVTNHYLPERKADGKIHPYGRLYEGKGKICTPGSIREVQAVINKAKREGKKVSVKGTGYSQGKQTLPTNEDNYFIDTRNLNSVSIDNKTKIATLGAGARWSELQDQANALGLAVQVMQASNVCSIGGSLGGANCHGWDHKMGSLGNTVEEIMIIDAQGQVVVLMPQDEQFKYVVGGYGLFGVIVQVKLKLTENLELFESSEEVHVANYVNYFKTKIADNENIIMHLYRLS